MAGAWRAAALLPLLSPAVSAHLGAQELAPLKEPTTAVRKLREIEFVYRTRDVRLSCAGVRNGVTSILLSFGAREDIDVQVRGCDIPPSPRPTFAGASSTGSESWRTSGYSVAARFPRRIGRSVQSVLVHVRVMMPIEVTAGVLTEIQKDKSYRELLTRVTGNTIWRRNDPILFPAQRRLVTLSYRADSGYRECSFVEQVSEGLLAKLDIRAVGPRQACDHDQGSRALPPVTFEALMPVVPAMLQLEPESGESEPVGHWLSPS